MSKIKPSRAYATEQFDRFGGLGQGLLAINRRASDMENFRIASDGSLKKRTGYRTVRQFPGTVRGYWEGSIAQSSYVFAISQSNIYRIDPLMGTVKVIDQLQSSSGWVDFIPFHDALYLIDGETLRVYDRNDNAFPTVTPYVPLYGRNWDPTNGGSMYEPLNLLTNHIRVSYTNTSNKTAFKLPFFCNRIDGVLVNGKRITDYSFTQGSNALTIPMESVGYTVEIGMEVMLDVDSKGIQSAKKAVVYQGHHHPTLCLYDSAVPYRLYCSSYVSASRLSSARSLYSSCQSLYFKDRNILLAGDNNHPVTALCPFGSHLIAYSSKCTWDISCPDDDGDDVSISVLLPQTGCTAPQAAIVCDAHPILVNHEGVFMIDMPKGETDKATLTCISDGIAERFGLSMAENGIAREDTVHHELWLRDPQASNAQIFVYDYRRGEWYLFGNMSATHFIDLPEWKGFATDNQLALLDNEVYTDDYEPITAYYQSGYFDFSHPEAKKRALRTTLCKTTPDCTAFLKLESEHAERSFEIPPNAVDKPDVFDTRALMGRFRYLRFRLLVTGKRDYRIYSVTFHANL